MLLVALCAATPALAQAQQGSPDHARRAAMEARRDSLEAEILNRFVDQLSRELRLDADQRARTERTLRVGAHRRRELMRASGELRGEMIRALRSASTTDAEFTRLLAQQESLRLRENDLWTREQDELARILSPRQRAQFIIQWARFQDNVREILAHQLRGQGPPR
jgi:Spy/CpxP family protein refolding chaperone